jgi:uncharacterized membrane protein (DUF373 family)
MDMLTAGRIESTSPQDSEARLRGFGGFTARTDRGLIRTRAHLGAIAVAENLVHYAVAVVLMVVAGVVLVDTTHQLMTTSVPFAAAATTAVNGVLFAIIIMEIMRTVIAHFDKGGLQLQPFLIIGIISAVREVLTVGARLSLEGSGTHQPPAELVRTALLELGVNAAVVLGLAGSLVLIRRLGGMTK